MPNNLKDKVYTITHCQDND